MIDEYTRECVAIEVARCIDAGGVVTCLERLARDRGAPAYVRFDHGPEFIAYAVSDWCRFNGTGTVFIDPGSSWQNASIEWFNGRLRDEYLNGQLFESSSKRRSCWRAGGSSTTTSGPTACLAGAHRSSLLRSGSADS